MNELKGKGAIVTGGGSGIGFAIARALMESGVNVVIASRRRTVLEDAAAKLNGLKCGKASPVVCDVRRKADIAALVQVPPPATEAEVNDAVLQAEDLASTVMFLLRQPGRIKYDTIGLYRF